MSTLLLIKCLSVLCLSMLSIPLLLLLFAFLKNNLHILSGILIKDDKNPFFSSGTTSLKFSGERSVTIGFKSLYCILSTNTFTENSSFLLKKGMLTLKLLYSLVTSNLSPPVIFASSIFRFP